MGLIAPVTVVGATVFHTADVLAGITMAQVIRPGAPVLFGGAPATFHMKIASSPMSAIEALQLDAAYVAVAKSLGLPTQSYMALTDGPILDAQAGAETFGSALIAALAGVNSVSGPGMLDFLLVFSLPKLVFDDEMCAQALRFVREVKVADDLPVNELIDQLMADQHLIMAPHTTAHWPEELYLPSAVVDRDNREAWMRAGGKDTYQRACEEVDRRLAEYQPLETDLLVEEELRTIIRSGLVSQTELPVLPAAPQPTARGGCRRGPPAEPQAGATRRVIPDRKERPWPGSGTPSSSPVATCARPRTGSAGRPRRSSRVTCSTRSAGTACRVRRGHPVETAAGHGFISSQRMGMDVFAGIDRDTPLIVAEAVWQYSHHVLPGLRRHRGPDPDGGQLERDVAGPRRHAQHQRVPHEDGPRLQHDLGRGPDRSVRRRRDRARGSEGRIVHDTSHVRDLDLAALGPEATALDGGSPASLPTGWRSSACSTKAAWGCTTRSSTTSYLNPSGIYKERLSQSALVAEMRLVTTREARAAFDWLTGRGMQFRFGADGATELTEDQVLDQLRLYIAAVRIADRFGCDAIGIQYQQGLKDMAPASDLAEGLLNDADRPPVRGDRRRRGAVRGRPVPHFNEVDEGSAVDALVTNRVWTALGLDPATTLHDVRWGATYGDDFVWVFEISGAVPPAHLEGGYAGAVSERQPPVYFGLGGGTIKGVSRPGEIVWSRVFIMDGALHVDLGRGTVVGVAGRPRRSDAGRPRHPSGRSCTPSSTA